MARIERKDRDFAKQIKTAGSSAALNAGEGVIGRKGHRDEQRLGAALNSAKKVRMALQIAVAWGYLESDDIGTADDLFDRGCSAAFGVLSMVAINLSWPRNPSAISFIEGLQNVNMRIRVDVWQKKQL